MHEEITFPIFLKDTDGCVSLVPSRERYFTGYYTENIDIEDGEYIGWDRTGLPLELCLTDDRPDLRITNTTPQPEALRKAIIDYGTVREMGPPDIPPDVDDPVVMLFIAEEGLRNYNRPTWVGIRKIKALLSGNSESQPK